MASFRDLEAILSAHKDDSPSTDSPELHVVVVVDDEEIIRLGIKDVLQDHYRVIDCASAEEGVRAVDETVCAVVMDVKMPGKDGFWACGEIHKKYPQMPVIFYSAYQDVKNPYSIINEYYPFGYMVKGGDVQDLLEKLSMAVALYEGAGKARRLAEGSEGDAPSSEP